MPTCGLADSDFGSGGRQYHQAGLITAAKCRFDLMEQHSAGNPRSSLMGFGSSLYYMPGSYIADEPAVPSNGVGMPRASYQVCDIPTTLQRH